MQTANGYAHQTQRRVAHCGGHVANLALFAFRQDDPQPGRRAVWRDGFGPLGELRLRNDQNLATASLHPFHLNPSGQLYQRFLRHLALHLYQVGFWVVVIGVGQPVHQRAVVAEEQEPLAIHVQATSRVNARDRDKLLERHLAFFSGERRSDPKRLVKKDVVEAIQASPRVVFGCVYFNRCLI